MIYRKHYCSLTLTIGAKYIVIRTDKKILASREKSAISFEDFILVVYYINNKSIRDHLTKLRKLTINRKTIEHLIYNISTAFRLIQI